VTLGDGAIGMTFKLTFLFCQSPYIDLLRAIGHWLVVVRIVNRREEQVRGAMMKTGRSYRYLCDVLNTFR